MRRIFTLREELKDPITRKILEGKTTDLFIYFLLLLFLFCFVLFLFLFFRFLFFFLFWGGGGGGGYIYAEISVMPCLFFLSLVLGSSERR